MNGTVVSAHAATEYSITDVGSVHIDSITNADGTPYNGVDADGNTITNGVNGTASEITAIVSLSGSINNMQDLQTGDTISIPVTYQTGSHYNLNIISGPITLTDNNGNTIFNVSYGSSGATRYIILTRTSTTAVGTYNFTLTLSKRVDYRSYASREALMSTSSVLYVGGSEYTITNKPVSITIDQTDFAVTHGSVSSLANSATYEASFRHAQIINNGGDNTSTGDIIFFARITPQQQTIQTLSFNTLLSRWNLAYDATHAGLGANDLFVDHRSAIQQSDIHDCDTAASTLKPGEYSISENADGTWDVAANLGAEQGDDAILTTDEGTLTWDDATNTLIRSANANKIAAQRTSFRFDVKWATASESASALVQYHIGRDDTTLAQGADTITNSLGSSTGSLQSGVVYDANEGSGTMSAQTGTISSDVALNDNGFTRTGYRFTGWNTKADGSGTSYQPGDTYTLDRTPVTLYAQWAMSQTVLPSTGRASTVIPMGVTGGLVSALALLIGVLAYRRSRTKPTM